MRDCLFFTFKEYMRYLSLFSGIESCSVAWKDLSWECVGLSEIDPFACAVLKHHYPTIPNLGDIKNITEEQIKALGDIDLILFGSPCQDLSTAGKRKGLSGERSSLFYEAIRIIHYVKKHCQLRFVLWENVYGTFTSNQGKDFVAVVESLVGIRGVNYNEKWEKEGVILSDDGLLEWCTLDAQWFGVPQQRRRVFCLADFGNWYQRKPILLEQQYMQKDYQEVRRKEKEYSNQIFRSAQTKCRTFRVDPNNSNAMEFQNE